MREITREEAARMRSLQGGFALVLAILALMLLTFLGLTLAVTTSTEFQIATNYRWSQQALYNAEAGIEIAKRYLQAVGSWRAVLPLPRADVDMGANPAPFCAGGRVGPDGEPSRNCELSDCDLVANAGYGVVLSDPLAAWPFQNVPAHLGSAVNGSFSLWVRRPLQRNVNGNLEERPADDMLILTAEGTAPSSGTSALALANRAVRYLEITLQLFEPGDCENRSGQIGSGPSGSGFDQCDPVSKDAILGGVGEPNPGQQ